MNSLSTALTNCEDMLSALPPMIKWLNSLIKLMDSPSKKQTNSLKFCLLGQGLAPS